MDFESEKSRAAKLIPGTASSPMTRGFLRTIVCIFALSLSLAFASLTSGTEENDRLNELTIFMGSPVNQGSLIQVGAFQQYNGFVIQSFTKILVRALFFIWIHSKLVCFMWLAKSMNIFLMMSLKSRYSSRMNPNDFTVLKPLYAGHYTRKMHFTLPFRLIWWLNIPSSCTGLNLSWSGLSKQLVSILFFASQKKV